MNTRAQVVMVWWGWIFMTILGISYYWLIGFLPPPPASLLAAPPPLRAAARWGVEACGGWEGGEARDRRRGAGRPDRCGR